MIQKYVFLFQVVLCILTIYPTSDSIAEAYPVCKYSKYPLCRPPISGCRWVMMMSTCKWNYDNNNRCYFVSQELDNCCLKVCGPRMHNF